MYWELNCLNIIAILNPNSSQLQWLTCKALTWYCSAEGPLASVSVSCWPWFLKGGQWTNVKHHCIIPSVPWNLRNFCLHLLLDVWAHDTRQNSSCRVSKILHLKNGRVWAMGYSPLVIQKSQHFKLFLLQGLRLLKIYE